MNAFCYQLISHVRANQSDNNRNASNTDQERWNGVAGMLAANSKVNQRVSRPDERDRNRPSFLCPL